MKKLVLTVMSMTTILSLATVAFLTFSIEAANAETKELEVLPGHEDSFEYRLIEETKDLPQLDTDITEEELEEIETAINDIIVPEFN